MALLRAPTAGTWVLALLLGALLLVTVQGYSLLSVGLVLACMVLFCASLWAAHALLGLRSARALALLGLGLGWFAEQMGSTRGWFFGRYTYTEVLGPRLGDVPLVIALMWFSLCLAGYVLACLLLWRQPVYGGQGWRGRALTAWLAAMLVTTFDLGADPYFVYVLKAWIMAKKDGGWFGETLQGFAGWMLIGFLIVGVWQWRAPPQAAQPHQSCTRLAGALPIGIYASGWAFQLFFGHPIEIRAIAFFAMGIPTLAAAVVWWQWAHRPSPESPAPSVASDIDLDAMDRVADPLADAAVAALVGPWPAGNPAHAAAAVAARVGQASRLMAGWSSNGALASWAPEAAQTDAATLQALRVFLDQGRVLPVWVDPAKIGRAEALFMDDGPLSCTLLFCASLPQCYVLPNLADVLHIAGQLEAHTEHRVRQTAAMIFPVMMRGGLTQADGSGVAQTLKVRLIHATIRHLILRGAPGQVQGPVPPLSVPGAQGGMHQALMAHGWNVGAQGQPCNQTELAYTLLTFSYVFLQGLRTLGQGLPRADEEAYLHAWNVTGHVLGIRSELMAHTMEQAQVLFARLQARARAAPPSPDVRPALGQALVNTMERAIALPVLRYVPVPLMQWLMGRQSAREIGVGARAPWLTRLVFGLGWTLVSVLDGVGQLLSRRFSLSRLFTRVLGYHLLTRVLLDQTRPLNLPEQVLNPLKGAVSAWGHDPRAHGWLNWLEDRLTVRGPWTATPKS